MNKMVVFHAVMAILIAIFLSFNNAGFQGMARRFLAAVDGFDVQAAVKSDGKTEDNVPPASKTSVPESGVQPAAATAVPESPFSEDAKQREFKNLQDQSTALPDSRFGGRSLQEFASSLSVSQDRYPASVSSDDGKSSVAVWIDPNDDNFEQLTCDPMQSSTSDSVGGFDKACFDEVSRWIRSGDLSKNGLVVCEKSIPFCRVMTSAFRLHFVFDLLESSSGK